MNLKRWQVLVIGILLTILSFWGGFNLAKLARAITERYF